MHLKPDLGPVLPQKFEVPLSVVAEGKIRSCPEGAQSEMADETIKEFSGPNSGQLEGEGLKDDAIDPQLPEQLGSFLGCGEVAGRGAPSQYDRGMRVEGEGDSLGSVLVSLGNHRLQKALVPSMNAVK
jgi:hypothetical protein